VDIINKLENIDIFILNSIGCHKINSPILQKYGSAIGILVQIIQIISILTKA
jgi:hypothetical protein